MLSRLSGVIKGILSRNSRTHFGLDPWEALQMEMKSPPHRRETLRRNADLAAGGVLVFTKAEAFAGLCREPVPAARRERYGTA